MVFATATGLRNTIFVIVLIAGLLAAVVIVFFSRTISRPIKRLSEASREVDKDNLDVHLDVTSRDEIGELSTSFNKMVMNLKENRDRLIAYSKELEARVAERTSELRTINEQLQAELTERKRMEEEREKLIQELQGALANVKALSGLLPICASCKKVRNDQGYWTQIEAYISDHSEAEFTHGLCPECAKKYYDELAKLKKNNPSGKNYQPPSV